MTPPVRERATRLLGIIMPACWPSGTHLAINPGYSAAMPGQTQDGDAASCAMIDTANTAPTTPRNPVH